MMSEVRVMCGAKVGGKASGKMGGSVWFMIPARDLLRELSFGGTSQREAFLIPADVVILSAYMILVWRCSWK